MAIVGIFERSWMLTKLSFGVIKQDKEMLLFPLLAGIFSLLFSVALLYQTIIVVILQHHATGTVADVALGVADYLILFVTYLGLSFIATFFSVCVVFTTKTRFEGGDATFMDSIKFAFSKLHLIFAWSLVSATVGLLLRALDQAAERSGAAGRIIIGIITAILGLVWSLITIFVIPAMVYHELGPIDAIKRSVSTLKETWGESIVRHYGLGLIQFLFSLLGILLTVGLFVLLKGYGATGPIIAICFGVVYFLGVVLVFNVANTVFNTTLYAYANNGESTGGFDESILQSAFRLRD